MYVTLWNGIIEVSKTLSNFALEFKTARERVIDNEARLKRVKDRDRDRGKKINPKIEVRVIHSLWVIELESRNDRNFVVGQHRRSLCKIRWLWWGRSLRQSRPKTKKSGDLETSRTGCDILWRVFDMKCNKNVTIFIMACITQDESYRMYYATWVIYSKHNRCCLYDSLFIFVCLNFLKNCSVFIRVFSDMTFEI